MCTLDASSSSCHLSPHFVFSAFSFIQTKIGLAYKISDLRAIYLYFPHIYYSDEHTSTHSHFPFSPHTSAEANKWAWILVRWICARDIRECVPNEHTFNSWNGTTLCYCLIRTMNSDTSACAITRIGKRSVFIVWKWWRRQANNHTQHVWNSIDFIGLRLSHLVGFCDMMTRKMFGSVCSLDVWYSAINQNIGREKGTERVREKENGNKFWVTHIWRDIKSKNTGNLMNDAVSCDA